MRERQRGLGEARWRSSHVGHGVYPVRMNSSLEPLPGSSQPRVVPNQENGMASRVGGHDGFAQDTPETADVKDVGHIEKQSD